MVFLKHCHTEILFKCFQRCNVYLFSVVFILFMKNTHQSIIQSSLLGHCRFVILCEPGTGSHNKLHSWWDWEYFCLPFDDLVLPLQMTAFIEKKKKVIGLGSNNVMAVTAVGSSFKVNADLWFTSPPLLLECIRLVVWRCYKGVLLYLYQLECKQLLVSHCRCLWPVYQGALCLLTALTEPEFFDVCVWLTVLFMLLFMFILAAGVWHLQLCVLPVEPSHRLFPPADLRQRWGSSARLTGEDAALP